MYFFDSGAYISGLGPRNFIPKLKKTYISQCKTYVFPVLDLQHSKTYILQSKIVFFDFQEAPEKSMSFKRCFGE